MIAKNLCTNRLKEAVCNFKHFNKKCLPDPKNPTKNIVTKPCPKSEHLAPRLTVALPVSQFLTASSYGNGAIQLKQMAACEWNVK